MPVGIVKIPVGNEKIFAVLNKREDEKEDIYIRKDIGWVFEELL
jgi:hypothetical protein